MIVAYFFARGRGKYAIAQDANECVWLQKDGWGNVTKRIEEGIERAKAEARRGFDRECAMRMIEGN